MDAGLQFRISRVRDKVRVSVFYFLSHLQPTEARIPVVSVLERNKVLTSYQHGFWRKMSCLTDLLQCLEAWTNAVDDGHGVDVICLDCRKAFDCVSHSCLIGYD